MAISHIVDCNIIFLYNLGQIFSVIFCLIMYFRDRYFDFIPFGWITKVQNIFFNI